MYAIILLSLIAICLFLVFIMPGTALLLSIGISAGSILWAVLQDNNDVIPTAFEMAAIIAGTFTPLITILIIRFKRSENEEKDRWPFILSRIILGLIWYLFLLSISFAVFNVAGIVLWTLYMVLVNRYFLSNRNAVELDIISTLGVCIRQNLPLPAALEIAGQSDKSSSRIFRKIHKWLTQGHPLSEALKRGFPKCSPYITSTITAAEELDQLPEGIKNLEKEMVEKSDDFKKIRSLHPGYPAIVAVLAVLLMFGMMIFIMPTFAEVLDDMGAGKTLPESTQILVDISDFMLRKSTLAVLIPLVTFTLLIYIFQPYAKLFSLFKRKRHTSRDGWIPAIKDFIKWHVPVLHWFENSYSLARVTGLLKIGLRSGHPVNVAISKACELDINHCFRKRMKLWLERVERGDNISYSALDCGIGKSVAWAFDEKVNAGNTPEILQMLEDLYRVNLNYKSNIARAVCLPVVIILLGCLVGFFAFAMFMPMVQIIEVLSESVVP